tara:strand:+ start:148 stop:348 length:201 start_codon:yes stop_codon:yes gene_type:complete
MVKLSLEIAVKKNRAPQIRSRGFPHFFFFNSLIRLDMIKKKLLSVNNILTRQSYYAPALLAVKGAI